ncbi:lipopolysaccharide biosynthesis protein [Rhabdaerophilum sp. SD176]|uniref:lipopolysaccharide biosynthesis protein n=1 Tax=Rhabdaerophilum sp. SD176 TaxID=2983548 RepID=UPI0024E00DAB|nr:lipopolysaccharide biosynthesis protein [Rhabdaerophilum sp. SD176]
MTSPISAVLLYAVSVAFGKGLVLFTLPFLTRTLPPEDFIRLDMAAALIEPIGLIGCLAIADTLFRFAAGSAEERARLARMLAGLAAALGLPLALFCQIVIVPIVAPWPNMPGETALRLALLSACLGAFIELPLAYWRLMGQPMRFTAFVVGRSLAQAALLIGGLHAGFGVDGVLIGNAVIDGLVILLLWRLMPGRGLPRFEIALLPAQLRYAGPVIGGGLAMFALGSLDRWFLAGAVQPAALAHYALATKLAMALALAIQPFGLWWYPRRFAILAGPEGPAETARFWLVGLALLCLGALAVTGAARLFVLGLFPPAYHGAMVFLPWLILLILLNELASLSNGPAYARAAGWRVLAVNMAAALVATLLYAVLIPRLGLAGAILATAAGQSCRLVLFWSDRGTAGCIPYPLPLGLAMIAATLVSMVMLADGANHDWAWPLVTLALLGLVLARAVLPMRGSPLLPAGRG